MAKYLPNKHSVKKEYSLMEINAAISGLIRQAENDGKYVLVAELKKLRKSLATSNLSGKLLKSAGKKVQDCKTLLQRFKEIETVRSELR
jgi:hypothetical protein